MLAISSKLIKEFFKMKIILHLLISNHFDVYRQRAVILFHNHTAGLRLDEIAVVCKCKKLSIPLSHDH